MTEENVCENIKAMTPLAVSKKEQWEKWLMCYLDAHIKSLLLGKINNSQWCQLQLKNKSYTGKTWEKRPFSFVVVALSRPVEWCCSPFLLEWNDIGMGSRACSRKSNREGLMIISWMKEKRMINQQCRHPPLVFICIFPLWVPAWCTFDVRLVLGFQEWSSRWR